MATPLGPLTRYLSLSRRISTAGRLVTSRTAIACQLAGHSMAVGTRAPTFDLGMAFLRRRVRGGARQGRKAASKNIEVNKAPHSRERREHFATGCAAEAQSTELQADVATAVCCGGWCHSSRRRTRRFRGRRARADAGFMWGVR